MKFNKPFLIRIVSDEHCKAVQERLFKLGFTWADGGRVVVRLNARTLCIDEGTISCSGEGYKSFIKTYEEVTLTDLYSEKFVGVSQVEVKLNDSHTALVTKDKITVGCQTFDSSIVNALSEALKKINA